MLENLKLRLQISATGIWLVRCHYLIEPSLNNYYSHLSLLRKRSKKALIGGPLHEYYIFFRTECTAGFTMLHSFLKYSSLSPNSIHVKTPTNFSWSRNKFSFSSAKNNSIRKTGRRVEDFVARSQIRITMYFSHCPYKFCLEDNTECL